MSNLDDYYNQICKEMITLKALRDAVITTGEQRLADWLEKVKKKEDEVDEMKKALKHLNFYQIEAKSKLEKRLISCLKEVKEIVTDKDAISQAMEAYIKEVATGKPKQYSWDKIKKFTSNFEKELGRGEFGVVYKGTLPDGVQVAVKVLHNNLLMDKMEKEFKAEVDAMSKTYHRNLAELYGFCFDTKIKALVYEYVDSGSLDQVLYTNPNNEPWAKLYKIAIGTAKGLSYLHESCKERIVHRDIKAGNVLLHSKHLIPKLTDFGLAKTTEKSQVSLTGGIRRARSFDAPEVRLETTQTINYKSDVFSFGMLLFEILSRKKWENRNSFVKQVWEKYQSKKLDEIIRDCGIEKGDEEKAMTLSIVALLCIEEKPTDRPSMNEVINMLTDVLLPKEQQNPSSIKKVPQKPHL